MSITPFFIRFSLFLFPFQILMGQTIHSRLLDAGTKMGIPYATVQFGEHQGVISNGEGVFSIVLGEGTPKPDSIHISSIGYGTMGIALDQIRDSILLQPKAIDLEGVYLFDRDLVVGEIIDKMKERIPQNVNRDPVKQRIFIRNSQGTHIERLDLGFEKSTIPELDRELIDSISNSVPRETAHFTESLMDLYKHGTQYKLDIIRAAELYNKDKVASLEDLGKRMEGIFKRNIKKDSYLKIKSGIFSQKMEVDSIVWAMGEEQDQGTIGTEERQGEKKPKFLESQRHIIGSLFQELYYMEDSNFDLIKKTNRYEFKLVGHTEIDGIGTYVIDFFPKGNRADFEGRLHIHMEDFAIVRLDFTNVRPLRNFRLLGITFREESYRGSVRFVQLPNGRYDLRFMEFVRKNHFAVERPLKVVEKNKHVKGRRKQNELTLNLDFRMDPTETLEVVVFGQELIGPSDFDSHREDKTVTSTYMPVYDPGFWRGHSIMEPNQALREFKVRQ